MMPDAFIVKVPDDLALSDDELLRLCEANRELRIERDAEGNLLLMSPSGSWTSHLNGKILPDFVIELRSPTDRLADLQAKMQEWLDNGCRLGWLLDPVEERAYVYRGGEEALRALESFEETLSGEGVLPGFVFPLNTLR